MADTQIHPTGTLSVPADYHVPPSAELLLKMVYAKFDGSGAAGSFKPCLRIISDAGSVTGEATTDESVAAGGSADVTWFPDVASGFAVTGPGVIIQGYSGAFAAADFIWAGPAFTLLSTGFPSNPTFTKISDTSALQIHLNVDFVPAGAPDVLSACLAIDGVLEENIFAHISDAGVIASVSWSKIRGLGNSSEPPLAAGAHTLDVQVSSASGAGNKKALVAAASDLGIIEFEP